MASGSTGVVVAAECRELVGSYQFAVGSYKASKSFTAYCLLPTAN